MTSLIVFLWLRLNREMAEGVGNAPTSAMPILFSRQVQPAYICLPSKLAARVGLAPTPNGLTGRRATFTPPGNGTRGRNLTFIFGVRSTALCDLSYASKSSPE